MEYYFHRQFSLSENNEALTSSINEQASIIEKQKSEISALKAQYDVIANLVTETYIETKEKAIITLNEYEKVGLNGKRL